MTADGQSVVYATDTEHPKSGIDRNLVRLSRDADLLIYDATYFLDEYEQRKGWGHSTWRHGVHLARAASVKQLLLFHHDPSHGDDILWEMEREADKEFTGARVAREESVLLG